jgi:hypothetical protein
MAHIGVDAYLGLTHGPRTEASGLINGDSAADAGTQ